VLSGVRISSYTAISTQLGNNCANNCTPQYDNEAPRYVLYMLPVLSIVGWHHKALCITTILILVVPNPLNIQKLPYEYSQSLLDLLTHTHLHVLTSYWPENSVQYQRCFKFDKTNSLSQRLLVLLIPTEDLYAQPSDNRTF
ncbi:13535_t:CDS:2, partial [Dentiscutata heterogama]